VKRFIMTMDTRRCVGCNACVIACKTENALAEGTSRDWVITETAGTFPSLSQEIRSERCNQCSRPPCVDSCPTRASHIGEAGVVLVSRNKCTGCKACIGACPYNARYVHPDGFVDKCTFCFHRTKTGALPACVEVCPTQALKFGDLEDATSEVSRLLRARRHKVNRPDSGAKPNVYFLI